MGKLSSDLANLRVHLEVLCFNHWSERKGVALLLSSGNCIDNQRDSGESMSKTFEYDVFLSHNQADKSRVRKLAEQLRTAGLRVWLDEWVIQPGDDIYLAVERGLEAARTLVLCLSPSALGSGWVTLERSTALFRDPSNVGRRFIPLLLVDCEIPDTLRRYKYVDYRDETQPAFDQVLAGCRPPEERVSISVASQRPRRSRLTISRSRRRSGSAPTKRCERTCRRA